MKCEAITVVCEGSWGLQCDASFFLDRYLRVWETGHLHLQGKTIFCPEDGGSEFVRNMCAYLQK
jgi:hypothetical protein